MYAEVGIVDILAMLGLFVAGFVMWLAWEMITGRKGLSMLLAMATFVAAWTVAGMVGIDGPLSLLLFQGAVGFVLVRVANAKNPEQTG
jgi:hypothetical protein